MRRLLADHPIGAFLVVGNAVAWAFAVSPVADAEIWLERPLYASLGTIFGVALAAFLVTAAADGRAAVVDLLRRTFRWRVPARWSLIALLGVPAATTVMAASFYGADAFESPADGWAHLLGVLVAAFVIQLVLFQLAEEVGWTGFFQERLHHRYSALRLTAVVAFFWAVWHARLLRGRGLGPRAGDLGRGLLRDRVCPALLHPGVDRVAVLPGRAACS